MYGLSNQATNALSFKNCTISENYGRSNTIHMLLSQLNIADSVFVNNYALFVTHGITLISSNLIMNHTLVEFNSHCHYAFNRAEQRFVTVCNQENHFEDRLQLAKLDTGFFNLYLTSNAHITNGTVVRNLLAQKQAVAYVIGKSSF